MTPMHRILRINQRSVLWIHPDGRTMILKSNSIQTSEQMIEANDMSQEEINETMKINSMTHIEMARLYRFAKSGHPYFDSTLPFKEIFMKRFNELGGMTPQISKQIGW